MKALRRFAVDLIMVSLSVIIVIIAAEALLRLTSYRRMLLNRESPRYYYRPDSVTSYDIRENFGEKVFNLYAERVKYKLWSNELGCFDRPYAGETDYALLVGDSFAFGYVPYGDNWATVAEEALGYRVLKCGVVGFSTGQELVKAGRVIEKTGVSPKLIIVAYFFNDLEEDYLSPKRKYAGGYLIKFRELTDLGTGRFSEVEGDLEERFRNWERYMTFTEPENRLVSRIKTWLWNHSIIYMMTKDRIKGLLSSLKTGGKPEAEQSREEEDISAQVRYLAFYPPKKYPWLEKAWENNLSNLKQFRDLAEKNGSRLLVVIIPYKGQVYPFLMPVSGLDLELPNRKLHAFFDSNDIDYIDLLPYFRDHADLTPKPFLDPVNDLYWRYDGHWNIKGNRLAGLLVSGYVLEKGLLDIPDSENKLLYIREQLKKLN